MRLWKIPVISFVFTYLFFFEYLPPVRRVHIPFDLLNFHYPLIEYAFQALRHQRFPEWDPTTYCGLSFAGNIQAALFYPPTWLLFASNIGRPVTSYQSLQDFVFMHVWLAFLLCYTWLRHKRLAELASILGAGVFAYSGYMLYQLQHLGLVTGYAWMPLGLWGIDQAVAQQRWQPLWKLAVASALCLLAGYPPTWFVFVVCVLSYAAWEWRTALGAIAAIGFSLLLCAVQILPAQSADTMKTFEARYGSGVSNPGTFLSYFLPNYFGFGLETGPIHHFSGEYVYLGAPALLGLACLVGCRRRRELAPPAAVLAVTLIMVTNPGNLVWRCIQHSALLAQICRDWYFLAGLTLAAAPLAAFGLDHCLRRFRLRVPPWMALLAVAAMAAWWVERFRTWLRLGWEFRSGWSSAADTATCLLLCSAAMLMLPLQNGRLRAALMAALLITAGVEYKVYGTSKWFNAEPGLVRSVEGPPPSVDAAVYRRLRSHPEYRVALDAIGLFPGELRRWGLTTPQGFDPLLPAHYKELIERVAHFRTNREFDLDPGDSATLRLLGVRYFLSDKVAPLFGRLSRNPHFRLLESSPNSHQVFEFTEARPAYGLIASSSPASLESSEPARVSCVRWNPEIRELRAYSRSGARLVLTEQFLPGWQAWVDGNPAVTERWSDAFVSVRLPPGEHQVRFRFRSPGLRLGAALSLLSSIALVFVIRRKVRPLPG